MDLFSLLYVLMAARAIQGVGGTRLFLLHVRLVCERPTIRPVRDIEYKHNFTLFELHNCVIMRGDLRGADFGRVCRIS